MFILQVNVRHRHFGDGSPWGAPRMEEEEKEGEVEKKEEEEDWLAKHLM